MRTIIIALTFLALTLNSNAQSMDIEVKTIENEWVELQSLAGEKLTVIDFWATWCKPCVNALPKLNELSEKYKSAPINFIGVNVDGPRNQAKVKPFTRSLSINYPRQ